MKMNKVVGLVMGIVMASVPFVSSASTPSFNISASAGAGASISPSGTVSVVSGDNQSFSIGASGGYHVSDVSVDGASVGTPSSYEFDNVTADHTISVSAVGNGGGGPLYCSGPMAPGWNVSLPNGGCPLPVVHKYTPSVVVKEANGSYTLMAGTLIE